VFSSRVASNVTRLFRDITSNNNAVAILPENVTSPPGKIVTRQDVETHIEPGAILSSAIKQVSDAGHFSIGLILQLDNESRNPLRFDIPASTNSSAEPVVLTTKPPSESLLALYIPSSTFVTILTKTTLQSWMSDIPDSTPLSSLSIPGTHNTPTCHVALPSVRCQAAPPAAQLQNGIRFFDVRVQIANQTSDSTANGDDATLLLVHGAFPVALTGRPRTFRALVDETQAFLRQHPSEMVIFSLKREGLGRQGTDAQLARILQRQYLGGGDATTEVVNGGWYAAPRIPALGGVRGKIVLLRRFALHDDDDHDNDQSGRPDRSGEKEGGLGLNASDWMHNSPSCQSGHVCVQDFCDVLEPKTIAKKLAFCCAHFERASAGIGAAAARETAGGIVAPPLFLNFLSGSNLWNTGCWPERIAAKINPAVTAFLCERHAVFMTGGEGVSQAPGVVRDDVGRHVGALGVVVCDWVGKDDDWSLVRVIIAMNGWLLTPSTAS
jgi:1-phosphatidylinositol phosphodiesterase